MVEFLVLKLGNTSLVVILQKQMRTGISLTGKTPLRDLFSKTKFNDIKEQSGLDRPDLFYKFKF